MSALDKQVGGSHYKDMAIQPIEYIHKNGLGFCEGNIVKYITRWKTKNGIEDLKKVIHYAELLIQMEQEKQQSQPEKTRTSEYVDPYDVVP